MYLVHAGTKGMKWGVRKYQNEDGTLTTEGKLRYARLNSKKDAKRLHYNNPATVDQASRYRNQDQSYKQGIAKEKAALASHNEAHAGFKEAQAKANHDRMHTEFKDATARAHHETLGKGSMPASAITAKQLAESEALIKKNIPASAWNQRASAVKTSPAIKDPSTANPVSGMPTSAMEAKAAAEAEARRERMRKEEERARRERMRKEQERAERERKMKANMPTSAWNAYKNR